MGAYSQLRWVEWLSHFAGKYFAVGVILFAVVAYLVPSGFTWIGPHISLLLGIVMFGMGLTLSAADFQAVFRQPKQVAIGVLAQFTIMPLLAFALAHTFRLPPEVAAGVILVGCCPGGTSSNVITLLARGNVALSVAMTSLSTLLAPVVTPALTLLLASQWLPVDASSMLLSVVKIVLLPIALGFGVKLLLPQQVEASVKALPFISIVAIIAIVGAVVGANQATLAETGLLLIVVVILHNGLGYAAGYLIGRWTRMEVADARAVAVEVGMQNSGLGAALASAHFSPLAAVPSALFSVWHNLSGSLLASWWRRGESVQRADVSPTRSPQSEPRVRG